MKEVLHAMDVKDRRAAIQGLTPAVRAALLAFMEGANVAPKSMAARPGGAGSPLRGADVWTVRRAGRLKYKARVYLNSLCLTTKEQVEISAALGHQAILERVRGAVAEESTANHQLWGDNDSILKTCRAAMEACGTSEEKLGLSACVILRAGQWLGNTRIVTPATTLSLALAARTRLARARSTSWEALRAAWIDLLQGAHAQRKLLPGRAEVAVDAARCKALRREFACAVRGVKRALESARPRRERLTAKVLQLRAAAAPGEMWWLAEQYRPSWQCLGSAPLGGE